MICAAPAVEGAWWRAQVISYYKDSNEVEIRYVDYGGYERVKIDSLRQIRLIFFPLAGFCYPDLVHTHTNTHKGLQYLQVA